MGLLDHAYDPNCSCDSCERELMDSNDFLLDLVATLKDSEDKDAE
jgi:hypothetical protein